EAVKATTPPTPSAPVVDDAVQDACDEILNRLEGWSKAYPEDIFHEPTKAEREWLHATKPGLMDCIAASMGRHMSKMIAADLAKLRAALSGVSAPVRVSWADFWIAQGDWQTANDYAAFEKAEQWLLAQQPAAAGEESLKGADVARPKRRPYNTSGSLSEY